MGLLAPLTAAACRNRVCQCFGNATTLNVMLLFFPISRSSFLHWWLGTDFPALIRYHRWLGHGTFVILIIHGPGHLCVFISQHVYAPTHELRTIP